MKHRAPFTGAEMDEYLGRAKTALQEHQDISHLASKEEVNQALEGKVDKVENKQLSTEDFTTMLKNKLEGLHNYDDTAIQEAVTKLQNQFNTLVSGNASTAIESFNEIVAFLNGVSDADSLEGIIAGIEKQISNTQKAIPTKLSQLENDKQFVSGEEATAFATKEELANKVDKDGNKKLSTEDFTTELKNKLASLENYDDANINAALAKLRSDLDAIVSGDTSSAIETFNEIIAFLSGIEDSNNLNSIIASIQQEIAKKQYKLVSGTNVKTINGQSILGSGNITINAGGGAPEGGGGTVPEDIMAIINSLYFAGFNEDFNEDFSI
jgi:hypothetical protein